MQDSASFPPGPPMPPTYRQPRQRSRWWIPVAVVAGIIVAGIIGISLFVGTITEQLTTSEKPVSVSDNTVLLMDLSSGVSEFSTPKPFNFGGEPSGPTLREVLAALDKAAKDPKIHGLYYRAGGEGMGYAKLTEIRDALVKFKSSGKFMYAFIEAGTKSHYYLASVADSVFMPQEGMLEFSAFGTNAPFLKGLFDKIGVEMYVQQYEEYKSAAETYSRTSWSEPAKQEVRALLAQRQELFVNAVATSRKLDRQTVTNHLDTGMMTADELLKAGLIDVLMMESDVREFVSKRLDPSATDHERGKMRHVTVGQYMKSDEPTIDDVVADKRIAIVYASGAIGMGKDSDPFDGEGIYPKNLIADLRRAANDSDIDGIILRIDSPGGSVIGSDEIWREIVALRAKKPIYASMSDVAASGGYYIAMACDTIIAHPATITGSIGVILMLPNLAGTMEKIGVTVDTINLGRSANMMNPLMPYTEEFKRRIDQSASPIYRRFVQKMADSRKKSFEDARAVAKGRVWTGQAAKDACLIDATGGLDVAINMMKKRIGVKPEENVHIHTYPEKKDEFEALLKLFGMGGQDEDEGEANATIDMLAQRLVAKAVADESTAGQVWKSLPPSAQQQLRHSAALLEIGRREHAMVALPALVPVD
ncbi:MAG: signal peptide peptidase SppA [Candidatus Kapabacteria bacterium]|nr:signal peptide peptidase SppA [Candidatus Kapabacteria bacterium]